MSIKSFYQDIPFQLRKGKIKHMKMHEKRLIGLRIKELRKNKGLSQEELAEKAETSPNYLSRMERGVNAILS